MNVGMLWFDNDPQSELDTKVKRATRYYHKKYGKTPTVCFVHPSMIAEELDSVLGERPSEEISVKSGEVEIRCHSSVQPNHFWIGVNGNNSAPAGS